MAHPQKDQDNNLGLGRPTADNDSGNNNYFADRPAVTLQTPERIKQGEGATQK